jgi:hypothetical protein
VRKIKKRKKSQTAEAFGKLRGHFRCDPGRLPVIQQKFANYERANIHLALEELLREADLRSELTGLVMIVEYTEPSLARLSRKESAKYIHLGPVEYIAVPMPGGQQLSCVKRGIFLIEDGGHRLALLVTEGLHGSGIVVEVMGNDSEIADRFLRKLTRMVRHGKAFRGNVLSLEQDEYRRLNVIFHHLPPIRRDELILPPKLLERIERHTLGFSRHAEKLLAANRHLKRGILLHGPPGTGKTLTAMYLAAQMPGRTVMLLTAGGMCAIEAACTFARMLAPATVILEDVDLIGTQREHQTVGANALLFELLNQMDGLADDVDILFILTTNRPDVLEPALASRPGRIDQAIEIPPPDAECRKRIFELYSRGLAMEVKNWRALVERTEGVSGAFIRELLRKATIFAAEDADGSGLVIREEHLDEALAELLITGGALTQSLLGVARSPQPS